MVLCTSPRQAWAILRRHAQEEMEPLRLRELLRDTDRVSALVTVHNTTCEPSTTLVSQDDEDDINETNHENRMLIVDLSRQRMTLETVNHLLKLSATMNLRSFILKLAWGQNTRRGGGELNDVVESWPGRPVRQSFAVESDDALPSMHLALRAPRGGVMRLADGTNALIAIHSEWDRIDRLSESIRRGQLRGATGAMIRDVVLIGRGTPVAAVQFVYSALLRDERAALATRFGLTEVTTAARLRRNLAGAFAGSSAPAQGRSLRFLTTIDPTAAASVLADLDPASTIVISLALNGNEETGIATKIVKMWLLQALGANRRADQILSKHMLLVTGNDRIVSVINKPERVHIVPEHSRCEAFTTFSPAGLLPLSIVFGWDVVHDLIQGAHDMDKHFVETTPRQNLPVLLALTDLWNDLLLGSSARAVVPFTEACAQYPRFVAAIESQTCCRLSEGPDDRACCSSTIIDAGLDGSIDRALYQSVRPFNTDTIMVMDNQLSFNISRSLSSVAKDELLSVQDSLMSSLFAHLDGLALGNDLVAATKSFSGGSLISSPGSHPTLPGDIAEGNRPSSLLMVDKLDAFACGQLLALAEHRALTKAFLCGLDPFVKEPGSSLRMHRTDMVKEELREFFLFENEDEMDDGHEGRLNLASTTLLRHYAALMRSQRVKGAPKR